MLCSPWSGLVRVAARVDLWPILRALGGPRSAAVAPPAEWVRAGLHPSLVPLLDAPPLPGPWVAAGGDRWPAILDDVPGGPVALTVEGTLPEGPAIAIVGARSCTGHGTGWSRQLAAAVAEAGGVVVSGLARGIDATAHEASLSRTIAVLGQGLATPMPGWQRRLRERIVGAGGAIVSELPLHWPPRPATFPARNRVIAGLASAVVVVEARHGSGAKITARHALEYGREVYAVPGPPQWETTQGCLDLLEDGATMVRGPAVLLDKLGLRPPPPRAGVDGSIEARGLRLLGIGG